jgi:hypothetical protein
MNLVLYSYFAPVKQMPGQGSKNRRRVRRCRFEVRASPDLDSAFPAPRAALLHCRLVSAPPPQHQVTEFYDDLIFFSGATTGIGDVTDAVVQR